MLLLFALLVLGHLTMSESSDGSLGARITVSEGGKSQLRGGKCSWWKSQDRGCRHSFLQGFLGSQQRRADSSAFCSSSSEGTRAEWVWAALGMKRLHVCPHEAPAVGVTEKMLVCWCARSTKFRSAVWVWFRLSTWRKDNSVLEQDSSVSDKV